jgi:hypothetical protein
MGKFAAAGPFADLPPELRPITCGSAIVRTLHAVIGAALLAASVAFALRVWRKPVELRNAPETEPEADFGAQPADSPPEVPEGA